MEKKMKKQLIVDTLMLKASDFKPVKLTEEEAGQYSAHWTAPIWNIGKLNLNGRVYPQKLAERIVAEAKATGVCDGHEPPMDAEYDNYKAVAKNPKIENDQMFVDIYFVDKAYAEKLDTLRKLGVEIGVSSVGYGDTDADGVVDPDTYELVRYCDFVQYPANETYAEPAADAPDETPADEEQGPEAEESKAETKTQVEEEANPANEPVQAESEDNTKTMEEENMGEKKEVAASLNEQAAMVEAQKADASKNNGIIEAEKKPAQVISESKRFINKIVEAVTVGTSFAGTVPTEIASQIITKRNQLATIRSLATVHQASGNYSIAVEATGVTVAYVGEGEAISDSTPDVTVITLDAYKIAALVKASREVLMDPAVDVQQYIVDNIAKKMAEFEENEFLNGTGSTNKHVTGILTTLGLTANAAQVITGGTTLAWDNVAGIDTVLGAYAPTATVVMNAATAATVRLMKDGAGHYIFPQNEALSQVLGHPVKISAFMPDNQIVAGDWSYYHIADRLGLDIQVLNELYAANDQVGIKAVERLDGACALPAAFVLVKTSA